MVNRWANLSIQPFVHLDLAAMPAFRMWIGVAEYLFRSRTRLEAAIFATLYDVSRRSDDLELSPRQCVRFVIFEPYWKKFVVTREFLESSLRP
jgi:prephenate dehydrogenase (NADP+)